MATLDQQRAALAFEDVRKVAAMSSEEEQKKYASLVHKLPALLRSAGLSQALHFVLTRKDGGVLLLSHFAKQLQRVDSGIKNAETLLDTVRKAELPVYLHLTREALACAAWYRRFVQGELKAEAG